MATPLKHRWSIANNYLAGVTLDRWLTLLHENRVSPAYWHRAALITMTACFNSLAARREHRHDAAIEATPLAGPPVFILGHWRSGTTHLHNLLALDARNFTYANTYQVTNPLTFLTTEKLNTRLFSWMIPRKRPMDDMETGFGAPQEDEFAPCLDTLKSPYLGISFPRRQQEFDRYLTFDGAPEAEVDAFRDALVRFCKKLTLRNPRPLLLKSPSHTARIRLLLDWFPGARFIHIHRHPHDVFRSTRHYWDTAVWFSYLQEPDRTNLDTEILQRYRALHDAFHAQRPLIPEGRFHELAFSELEADPMQALEAIYQSLRLPQFDALRPTFEAYLARHSSYRKNSFTRLPPETVEQVNAYAAPELERWNYPAHP